jgi:polysaccharide deacetylase family protein (PEP-CTERM system associated)
MAAFTIDLEDWHQMLSRRLTGHYSEPSATTVSATKRLLDILDATNTRGTFFVVGMLAECFPDLVREVHRRGHEIASHSYTHRPIFSLAPDEFREDLRRSVRQLSDLIGQEIRGFRAPEFSVGALDHWCFDVLAELGFAYDSSVFPIGGPRYGIADAPPTPFQIQTRSGPLWEFPLWTWKWHGWTLPLAGGTYYRFLPKSIIARATAGLKETSAATFYFHPYEFSDVVLRLENLDSKTRWSPQYLKYRLLHNLRTPRILRVLQPVLQQLDFRPLGETCGSLHYEPAHS